MSYKKYPVAVSDLPSKKYFAILQTTSVYIPGDERSRTNPGHGYPGGTETHWSIMTFETREEWVKEIQDLTKDNKIFQAIEASPARVDVDVKISVR
jgi:hypothetical protein